MQGVHEDSTIFHLIPLQIGVFLTFVPPMKGYVLHRSALLTLRRSFGIVIKKLISDDLDDQQKNGWTNVLTALPYMHLQYEKNRPDIRMRSKFYQALQSEDAMSIKASDFKKKAVRVKTSLDRRCDFRSRRYKEADKSVISGDCSKAMQSLLKIDSRVNLGAIKNTIKDLYYLALVASSVERRYWYDPE